MHRQSLFFVLFFPQRNAQGEKRKMAKDYSPQFSAILLTLRNINDHLKAIEEKLSEPKPDKAQKHIVLIKAHEKKGVAK